MHLLVIDVNMIGMIRNYARYVPDDDPRATVKGVSYRVDLKNNRFVALPTVFFVFQ